MGEATFTIMPGMATHTDVFESYKAHCNLQRLSTDLVMLEVLRKSHPEFHVTRIDAGSCDLLGYASAGHATATLDSDESYNATRSYKHPGPRSENLPGVLTDNVHFGRWKYDWKDIHFVVYQLNLYDPHHQQLFFVLSPRSAGVASKLGVSDPNDLLLAVGAWSSQVHDEVYVFDNGRWSKSCELWKSIQDASWNDVILSPEMKSKLIEDVEGFFSNQSLYRKLHVPWKRGVILHGVPGNGKTISIKALINSLAKRDDPIPSLYVKSFDNCQGEKFSIRNIFNHARRMSPCLLIFEDLDSLVQDKTRSYFLNEVDGLESNDGILMVGSTNHLDKLDPAISKRPSRFDRKYHFRVPSEKERIAYCQFWKGKLEDTDLVEFPETLCPVIGKLSEGFSFAYMKELFVGALLTIARGTIDEVINVEKDDASSEDSSDSHVIVEHGGASTENTKAAENDSRTTSTELSSEKNTGRRKLPKVEIPEELQCNVLLKVIHSQIQTLIDEMDDTEELNWPSTKKQGGGVPGAPDLRSPMKILSATQARMSRVM